MIKIDGLTAEQVDMLDIIWNFKTKDEYLDWMETLDDYELELAQGLMKLLALAMIDEAQEELADPYKDARLVIQKIQSKFDTK
jgi:hypothetical protein